MKLELPDVRDLNKERDFLQKQKDLSKRILGANQASNQLEICSGDYLFDFVKENQEKMPKGYQIKHIPSSEQYVPNKFIISW